MTVKTQSIHLNTKGNADIIDITSQVNQAVSQSGVVDGVVTIFCPSSTSALTTIEFESGCLADLRRLFDEILPSDRIYAHNASWGDGNGHAHVRAALLGPSLAVPLVSGRLTLGTWQQIIYIDFDTHPRQRELVLQVIGELSHRAV
ncbi:MAG: secondary thiamine-phosphate synthase enzyme YjbQ [Anaerolineales bacterium]|nr:secondary thiamine-phosphate synthase enzyme YjbQ [Anaerolineales bacterium]